MLKFTLAQTFRVLHHGSNDFFLANLARLLSPNQDNRMIDCMSALGCHNFSS